MNNISVLIADDDLELVQELSDHIKTEIGLTLVATACNGLEAFNLILETEPDVVILDLIMPVLDGNGVLERLKDVHLSKIPKIILYSISSQILNMALTVNSEIGIDYCLLKPQSCDRVCNVIRRVMSELNNAKLSIREEKIEVEEFVTDLLYDFGFSPTAKGFYYFRSAIIMVAKNMELQIRLTKELYPKLAKQYDISVGCLERSMRSSIETAWQRGNTRIKNKYFRFGRPTNGEFILTIADRVKLIYKE